MSDINAIGVRITADTTDAQRAITELNNQLSAISTSANQVSRSLERTGRTGAMSLATAARSGSALAASFTAASATLATLNTSLFTSQTAMGRVAGITADIAAGLQEVNDFAQQLGNLFEKASEGSLMASDVIALIAKGIQLAVRAAQNLQRTLTRIATARQEDVEVGQRLVSNLNAQAIFTRRLEADERRRLTRHEMITVELLRERGVSQQLIDSAISLDRVLRGQSISIEESSDALMDLLTDLDTLEQNSPNSPRIQQLQMDIERVTETYRRQADAQRRVQERFDALTKETDQNTDAVERNTQQTQHSQRTLRDFGSALAGIIAITGLRRIVQGLTDAFTRFEDSTNALRLVFRDFTEDVTAQAATAAQNFGLSLNEYQEAATGLGAALGGTITDSQELARVTNQLVGLAGDAASAFGGTAREFTDRFISALSGSAEVLRRYGVDLSEANLQGIALRAGIIEVSRELTENEKRLARVAGITESLSIVQGDFANTSTSLKNSIQTLNATFSDTRAVIGDILAPVLNSVVRSLTRMLTAFMELNPFVRDFVTVFTSTGVLLLATLATIGLVVRVVGTLATSFQALTAAISGTNIALSASGLGLILLTITAVTGAILGLNAAILRTNFRNAEEEVRRFNEALEGVDTTAERTRQQLLRIGDSILPEEIVSEIDERFRAAYAEVEQGLDDLAGQRLEQLLRRARIAGGVENLPQALQDEINLLETANQNLNNYLDGLSLLTPSGNPALFEGQRQYNENLIDTIALTDDLRQLGGESRQELLGLIRDLGRTTFFNREGPIADATQSLKDFIAEVGIGQQSLSILISELGNLDIDQRNERFLALLVNEIFPFADEARANRLRRERELSEQAQIELDNAGGALEIGDAVLDILDELERQSANIQIRFNRRDIDQFQRDTLQIQVANEAIDQLREVDLAETDLTFENILEVIGAIQTGFETAIGGVEDTLFTIRFGAISILSNIQQAVAARGDELNLTSRLAATEAERQRLIDQANEGEIERLRQVQRRLSAEEEIIFLTREEATVSSRINDLKENRQELENNIEGITRALVQQGVITEDQARAESDFIRDRLTNQTLLNATIDAQAGANRANLQIFFRTQQALAAIGQQQQAYQDRQANIGFFIRQARDDLQLEAAARREALGLIDRQELLTERVTTLATQQLDVVNSANLSEADRNRLLGEITQELELQEAALGAVVLENTLANAQAEHTMLLTEQGLSLADRRAAIGKAISLQESTLEQILEDQFITEEDKARQKERILMLVQALQRHEEEITRQLHEQQLADNIALSELREEIGLVEHRANIDNQRQLIQGEINRLLQEQGGLTADNNERVQELLGLLEQTQIEFSRLPVAEQAMIVIDIIERSVNGIFANLATIGLQIQQTEFQAAQREAQLRDVQRQQDLLLNTRLLENEQADAEAAAERRLVELRASGTASVEELQRQAGERARIQEEYEARVQNLQHETALAQFRDNQMIAQQQYDLAVAQDGVNRSLGLVSVGISTAEGIIRAISEHAGNPVLGGILAGVVALTGVAQTAAILSQPPVVKPPILDQAPPINLPRPNIQQANVPATATQARQQEEAAVSNQDLLDSAPDAFSVNILNNAPVNLANDVQVRRLTDNVIIPGVIRNFSNNRRRL